MFVKRLPSELKIANIKRMLPQFQQTCKVSTRLKEKLEPVLISYATYEHTDSVPDVPPAPFVIMHGLFGSKSNWNSLCKIYQQKSDPKRKIIAVDARNHGDSPHSIHHTYDHLALDLKNLLDKLGIEKVSVMGHSMGGKAMMIFALRYPQLVEKLIVADISPVSVSPKLSVMTQYLAALQNVIMPKNVPLSKARLSADQQLAQSIYSKMIRSFLLTNLVQKQDGSYKWRINIPALTINFENISQFPIVEKTKYEGPVLFVAGTQSDYIRKNDHPEILKLFPKAKFEDIEGAGHWLHSEKPADFLKITLDFLNEK